jgi:signal transduction histidine kinase/CheY-like chemotaxis protein
MGDQPSYEELYKHLAELEAELNEKNELINSLKLHPDDTELKKIERELQRTKEKALSSDRLKSAFLANMSHAIRTPMNAIIGFSELIGMENISPKRKEEYIQIIKEKGHQLLSLIDDIIEISKIESGKLNINYTDINLDEFLNEIYSIILQKKIKAGKDQVELILQKNPQEFTGLLQTDPGRLQEILNNLLSFSIQNTLKGNIEFGYEQLDPKTIEFFIHDTGIGLNKEDQKIIFDYFWQFEDITHQRLSGIGLSITIAKKIIEQLGGKITITSELNQGTQFRFTIPVEKPNKIKSERYRHDQSLITPELEPVWKDKVILIVEDDEVNYQFIEALLEKTQVQLLHTDNGQQALELVKTINKIDLILMDIKLPDKNGYQITREIKQIRNDIPIIAHTAFQMTDVREKCLEAGCIDVISKPIEIPLFLSIVNKYIMGG